MNSTDSPEENSILYELLVHSEWTKEEDVVLKQGDTSLWPLTKISGYLKNYSSGAFYISDWISQQLPWLFSVGSGGKTVAILQDTVLEIRTQRDNYATPIGKAFINKDSNAQWRKLEWSPDGTLLAVAHSNGVVDVYDLLATHLFQIPSTSQGAFIESSSPSANAIAGLVFVDTRTKNAHWSYELLCINFAGQLHAYFVSPTQGFEPSHTFSFDAHLPYGVTSVCADYARHLIVIASPIASVVEPMESKSNTDLVTSKCGLSCWRLLDDRPFYIQAPNQNDYVPKRWLKSFQRGSYGNTIVKLSPSKDGTSLAAIHYSGAVSIWSLPSLKCQHFWPLDRQPGFDEMNPALLKLPAQRRIRSPAFQNPFKFHPVDINWWSDDSIILARCSGAVTVCETHRDLRNQLGSSAEFFEGSPRIFSAFDSTFLGLECEVKVQRKRLQPTEDVTASPNDEAEETPELSDEEEISPLPNRITRSVLYWITDSERFQPPRKRPKLLAKTFRLLGFKKTTPEELYLWKLDAEEYGEALALARAYGLDCDLVYQRQWRNVPATIASINDYLSKVAKRNWVLRECLERVPEDVDAARELLIYGLKNTDLAVVVGGEGVKSSLPLDSDETEEERIKREEERRRYWLAKLDFNNLTVEQKMLISTRRRLLQFLDRLSIYETILGGPHAAGQRFEPSFFEKFRAQSALESAANFARQGDWQAVAVMLTFNGAQTLPHRLAICSSFPETLPPFEYRSILPECDVNGDVFLWEQQNLREPDWCECPAARMAVDVERVLEAEAVELFYSEETKLKPFSFPGVELSTESVALWYLMRAADIEKQSMLVENALDLIKLGIERNVPRLELINHHLLTLETLVYDLHHDNLNLEKLNAMSELEICQLIMSRCDETSFLPTLHRWLIPYLLRLDLLEPGRLTELLRGLLLVKSQEDLSWTYQVCSQSKADVASPIVTEATLLISLALDCIYACQQTNQLEVAMKIYDCLPERPSGGLNSNPELTRLHDQLDRLQSHLEAADILENHGVPLTPAVILEKQMDEEQTEQLFVRLTRTVMRKTQPLTENQWKDVLGDMLELQEKSFNRISPQMCYEILVGSLLSSCRKENIAWAGLMLQLDRDNRSADQGASANSKKLVEARRGHYENPNDYIPFERSKQLILQAAEEYFNSSENLSDPSLELANYCLGLVTIEDEQIQEEKDLIAAVGLLYDYGLDMPPLKIRLSRNRLLLIDQVLKQAGKSYKNASRLLRLGHLLRASQSTELIEGHIHVRIAEIALSKQDFDVASQMCSKLRMASQSVGWKVCVQFARLDEVTDVSLKMNLVSFALVHCSADAMEELLQLRWTLEATLIRDKCRRQVEMYVDYESGNESLLDLLDPVAVDSYRREVAKKRSNAEESKQVFQKTAETTKQLVDVVKSKFKNQTAAAAAMLGGKPNSECKGGGNNRSCTRWAVPVFYWEVWKEMIGELHESQLASSYRLFSLPETTCSELNLLTYSWRLQILDSLRQPYSRIKLKDDSVLAKLLEFVFPEDCVLALSILFDVKESASAWVALTKLPSTEVTLQTAAIYFAIRIMRLDSVGRTTDSNLDQLHPRTMIDSCSSRSLQSLTEEQRIHQDFLKRSLRLLADVSEAQQLRRLDSGVDINRFTTDEKYKCDTIVGLAITTDSAVYDAAVRLAAHYGVPQWQVCFSHLTALFTDEKMEPNQLKEHMDENKMSDILYQDKDTFGPKLVDIIYPSISGRDHERLVLFFNLLNADATMAEMVEPSAPTCLKILELLQSTHGIDVKKLMRSADGFVFEVDRAVNGDNVSKLAKLAQFCSTSVKSLASNVNQGTVHSLWARKYFFQLVEEAKKGEKPLSAVDWLHRFENCKSKHTSKLATKELLQFVDGLCFSEQVLDTLTLDVRAEICRRCHKMLDEKHPKKKTQKGGEGGGEDARSQLEKWSCHLERLRTDEYCQTIRTEVVSTVGLHFWREFESSRAEEDKLHRLLLRVLVQKHPMSVVQLLIGIFPSDFCSTPEDVLLDALRFTLDCLRFAGAGTAAAASAAVKEAEEHKKNKRSVEAETPLLGKNEAMQVLLHLLTLVRGIVDGDGDGGGGGGIGLISQSDIDDMLSSFYEDDAIDVHVRLHMLQTLPADYVGAQCGSRIRWLRTLALIQQTWLSPSSSSSSSSSSALFLDQLCEEDLESEQQRRVLFDRLLEISHEDLQRLSALSKVLHFWPPFSSSESDPSDCTPWIVLWKAMSILPTFPSDKIILESLTLALEQKPALSDRCIQYMYETANNSLRLRLHIALQSSLESLLDDVVRSLDATPQLSVEDYDAAILDLVIERGLVGRLASTPLYGPLCDRLLSQPESIQLEQVAGQLVLHGHRSDAGHLLHLNNGCPRYLLNFSSSLFFARRLNHQS